MKYSRTSSPSLKFDLIGSSMVCPVVSAISPRIPASCFICLSEPLAPESAIMNILLYASSPSSRSLVSLASARFHVSITSLYLSSSVTSPRWKFLAILSTVASASAMMSFLLSGTVISDTETVIAAIVENLYPIALILSKTSAVFDRPWTFITFSSICLHCFFFTKKSTSKSIASLSTLLSINPRSCGMISLNKSLPTVVSILPVTTFPLSIFLLTLTVTFACKLITLLS